MRQVLYILLLSIFLFIYSCENDNEPDKSGIHPVFKETLSGFAQKGPFIVGSSITIAELDAGLNQTGRTFNAQISANDGSFEISNVELASQFIELKADGFYFNEVLGDKSSAQVTLYALSDLTDKSTLNVNILSHLEARRIKTLIKNGLSFENAKKQAQEEVLMTFSIQKTDIVDFEMLDIAKEGDDNAILLAVSLITQGFRTEADLAELLAELGNDLADNGKLDNPGTGSKLINHGRLIRPSTIRENLDHRFNELGIQANIPEFEKYLDIFLEDSPYEITNNIEYPESSNYGRNILYEEINTFKSDSPYSMAANLPVGTQLKIVLSGGLWYYNVSPNGPVNWDRTQYDKQRRTQTFTSIESGKNCDLLIYFAPPQGLQTEVSDTTDTSGSIITVDFYENFSEEPTRTKMLYIDGTPPVENP